jgi:hypothetical protein
MKIGGGVNVSKSLMAVEVLEISSKYIYELRMLRKRDEEIFDILPEFTINTNEGAGNQIITAKYYHQFVGSSEEEEKAKYLYFRLLPIDNQLEYEVSQCGAEEFFKGLDFKKILSIFVPETDEDMKRYLIPRTHYLIVESTYTTSVDYFGGGSETELEVDIIGYLNSNLESIYFDND